jgi:hypothetical protein
MGNFYGNITLHLSSFSADDIEQAREVVDVYIDELTKTGGGLTWEEVSFDVQKIEEEK